MPRTSAWPARAALLAKAAVVNAATVPTGATAAVASYTAATYKSFKACVDGVFACVELKPFVKVFPASQ